MHVCACVCVSESVSVCLSLCIIPKAINIYDAMQKKLTKYMGGFVTHSAVGIRENVMQ